MSKVRRAIAMGGGYIAASLVAGAIIAAAMVWSPGREIGPVDLEIVQVTVFFLGIVSSLVAILALLPAALVSWYAERRGKRSAIFYGGAGALVSLVALGIFMAVLIVRDASKGVLTPMDNVAGFLVAVAASAAFFALAGVAGGLTYWLIAGRTTGSPPVTPVSS
jgi:hypothetical protein